MPNRHGSANLHRIDTDGNTRLIGASRCWKGHLILHVVKYLVQHAECDILRTDHEGGSSIWIASWEGHVSVVRYMPSIADEANIHRTNYEAASPVIVAPEAGHLDVVSV